MPATYLDYRVSSSLIHYSSSDTKFFLTYCEIFILTQKEFNHIKAEYPELREVLKQVSSEKTEKVVNLLLKGVTL